jgi:hypothetical protein
MMSNNITLAIVLGLLCLAFVMFLWREGTGFPARTDARESKKAEDTGDDPKILDTDQQAAELQIGEDDELRNRRRFAPDQQ